MAAKTQIGSLPLGNLGVDILCSEDKEGRRWYMASVPKVYSRGNSGVTAKSLERLQIPAVIALLQEAEKKLAELETSEPIWEPLRDDDAKLGTRGDADTRLPGRNGDGPPVLDEGPSN